MLQSEKSSLKLMYSRLRSGQLLLISYLCAITVGAILLCLPFATVNGDLPFIDALFTSTSAVCVTGLVVVDTGTVFTLFGKIVLLLLIQMGGLGIMTFSVLMFLTVGRLPALRDRWIMESMYSPNLKVRIWDLIKAVFIFTIICEGTGAILLAAGWINCGFSPGEAIWYGVFHSVSAFCNAGFAFFKDSLISYRGDWLISLTVCGLIITGGIGFSVMYELFSWNREKKRRRLTLNTRLVLWTTLFLLVSGTVLLFFSEWNNALKGLPLKEKVLISFFQSTTARTAGYNTVDISYLCNASILVLVLLMFIGTSPGSCGGGVRTTSLALLAALFVNRMKGNSLVHIGGRTVPEKTIKKMISLVMLAGLVVVVNTLLLLLTQTEEYLRPLQRDLFVQYLFETVSALGTVGLSMGITASLNFMGKLLIITIMLIGRVGLVTLAYELVHGGAEVQLEYASEEVML